MRWNIFAMTIPLHAKSSNQQSNFTLREIESNKVFLRRQKFLKKLVSMYNLTYNWAKTKNVRN